MTDKTKKKRPATPVFLTKKEAEIIMDGMENLFIAYPNGSGCKKCDKTLMRALRKIDAAFGFGIFE